MHTFTQTLKRAGLLSASFLLLLQIALPVTALADNTPPGNNGTLKVHELGTPSNSESNDPKVCVFNFEGFGLDPNQTGNITIATQSGAPITPIVVPFSSNSAGNGETVYLNSTSPAIVIPNGHYKATLDNKFGTDPGDKAKSKVFKVECGAIEVNKEVDLGQGFVSDNPSQYGFLWGLNNETPTRTMGSTAEQLAPGDSYSITENTVPGYEFVGWYTGNNSCTELNGTTLPTNLTVYKNKTRHITLCNKKSPAQQPVTGSVTIVKDAQPNSLQDFTFASSLDGGLRGGSFDLDDDEGIAGADDSLDNSLLHDSLTAATHTFTESAVSGWELTAINCTGTNGAVVNLANRSVSINLLAGENVVCTFVNTQEIDDVIPDVDYCDPSQRPNGQSIAQWLSAAQFNGADCFSYDIVKSCGNLNVILNDYPTKDGWAPYRAIYTVNGTVVHPANSFPANFTEDLGNGSVNVTWYLVGPEKDYLVGSGLPNFWDGTSQKVTVDTDCEDPDEPEEPVDPCDPFIKASAATFLRIDNPTAVAVATNNISGCKFHDENKNGAWDNGEETLSGFEFKLYTCSNSVNDITSGVCEDASLIDAATTNAHGVYSFNGLTNGTYMVCETERDGWVQSYPVDDQGDAACWLVPVTNKDCIVNFGNKEKEPGKVLGETPKPEVPQVLAQTGSPLLQGLLVSMSIITAAGTTIFYTRKLKTNN